ncbi:spore cortex-lytic enzyme [Metallumcola ferriviriculae]|uniref:Spore cortex-lytic enzyme n=1 Tax=Metallumcola ferriviriculae TaxID=3039180 RepID=A0AAU0UMB7_9FIRM|nr:spore cortex-lytic enzyme [Desulfitibacteraceae bacterium MK1]
MRRQFLLVIFIIFASLCFYTIYAQAQYRPSLYYGSTGEDVSLVQQKLRDWGYYDGPIDGYYGGSTYEAVRLFQQKNGLRIDGVVGESTWQALGEAVKPVIYTKTSGISQNDDIYLLSQLISAEARAEPLEGQVAVGAVILNRIQSAAFPNTLAGVVFQPLAFEPVSNGTIYRSPVQESVRAAQLALNGWDPTYGALYFWNPNTATSRWIWSRTPVTTIGKHVFAR